MQWPVARLFRDNDIALFVNSEVVSLLSKTLLRAAEDVDGIALSYSKIKAPATGNALIIEKCGLDMQFSKLNMLKASHLNQRYAMEEMVAPFAREEELRENTARLKELNILLNMDEKDKSLIDDRPE